MGRHSADKCPSSNDEPDQQHREDVKEEGQGEYDRKHDFYDDEHEDIGLLAPFGAGLKRKRVEFVRASTASIGPSALASASTNAPKSGRDISDLYLSLVSRSTNTNNTSPESAESKPHSLYQSQTLESHDATTSSAETSISEEAIDLNANLSTKDPAQQGEENYCPTCDRQVNDMKSHVQSIAHMSSELHSDPPHHLDRNSEGFKHMVSLGWDPDRRRGLGPAGDGIRYPIRPIAKDDMLGIGAKKKVKRKADDGGMETRSGPVKLLGPKQMRKLEIEERTKRRSIHDYLSK